MTRVATPLVVLAACGRAAAPATTEPLSHTAPTAAKGDVIRVTVGAETRDCPAGVLEALAPVYADQTEGNAAQLDACLAGRVGGDDVVFVYVAAPNADPESIVAWPSWRVVVTPGGAIVARGPDGWGGRSAGIPSLDALADLDGDGTHEVIEQESWGDDTRYVAVWQLRAPEWVELTTFVIANDDGCRASWVFRDGALVVTSSGEDPDAGESLDVNAPRCLAHGEHVLRLVDGALRAE